MNAEPTGIARPLLPAASAWRIRQRRHPGMTCDYPWHYTEQARPAAEDPAIEVEPVYGPDEMRQAQREAAREALVGRQGEMF